MPVRQHPVPQHISSYEFRLIGEMTLKQFGYLAAGVLLGLFFYSLPLSNFIKWPLILFFIMLGGAFAFVPIEERPLPVWIWAFVKALFSPTIFIWQKNPVKPEFLEKLPRQTEIVKTQISSRDQSQLLQYLKTLPKEKGSLDKKEEEFLKTITALFQTSSTPSPKTSPISSPLSFRPFSAPPKQPSPPEPLSPKSSPPSFTPKPPIEVFIFQKRKEPPKQTKRAVPPKISKQLPIPIPPSQPNIISGMVFDQKGEIIEGAILEIRNDTGMPVRALKTNKLGQFIIATPLENGIYEIEVEKEGYQFDIIKIEAKGEIIPPIEIRAK